MNTAITGSHTSSLQRINPIGRAPLCPELDPTHAVGIGILAKGGRTTDPIVAERQGLILESPEDAQEFLQLAKEHRDRSAQRQVSAPPADEPTPATQSRDSADLKRAEPVVPCPAAPQAPEASSAGPNRISYLQGIALKERGVILHGMAALARRDGVPEKGRDGLNSSRREKLLGLVALILRTEERGQVLKSSYGTLAAKLETSESTVKDLLTKVSSLGLYTMQFDSTAQMWELQSGPALEPQAWIQLLKDGQRELKQAINTNTKENVVWCGDRSWKEARRYPKRQTYERQDPVVVKPAPPVEVRPVERTPINAGHPGEVHHPKDAPQPRPGSPAINPGPVRTYHPGEVHLGIESTYYTCDSHVESLSMVNKRSNTCVARQAEHREPPAVVKPQDDLSESDTRCVDQPRCSNRSLRSLTTHLGMTAAHDDNNAALDYGSVVTLKGHDGRYVVKGLSWGDTPDGDSVRCVSLDNPDEWLTSKMTDVEVVG